MQLRFDDRVAVITGAGRGLGRAYAQLLARKGARVVVNDVGASVAGLGEDATVADEVVDEIRRAGGEAVASGVSIATPAGGRQIIETAMDTYGRIDILIHNAGIIRRAGPAEMTAEDFEAVLDVHLRGGFHVAGPAFARMARAGYGRVVLTSSAVGVYGAPGQLNYAAAKGGLLGMTSTIALEGAGVGVTCNAIIPGALTRMAGAPGGPSPSGTAPHMDPDEVVAPVVGWLAHETCNISGEFLTAMSGRVARVMFAETPGIARSNWSMEDVARNADAIRSTADMVVFPAVGGISAHMKLNMDMGRTADEADR